MTRGPLLAGGLLVGLTPIKIDSRYFLKASRPSTRKGRIVGMHTDSQNPLRTLYLNFKGTLPVRSNCYACFWLVPIYFMPRFPSRFNSRGLERKRWICFMTYLSKYNGNDIVISFFFSDRGSYNSYQNRKCIYFSPMFQSILIRSFRRISRRINPHRDIRKIVIPKIRSLKKSISMILRLEIISSVVSCERKSIIFYEKNLILVKIILLIMIL